MWDSKFILHGCLHKCHRNISCFNNVDFPCCRSHSLFTSLFSRIFFFLANNKCLRRQVESFEFVRQSSCSSSFPTLAINRLIFIAKYNFLWFHTLYIAYIYDELCANGISSTKRWKDYKFHLIDWDFFFFSAYNVGSRELECRRTVKISPSLPRRRHHHQWAKDSSSVKKNFSSLNLMRYGG